MQDEPTAWCPAYEISLGNSLHTTCSCRTSKHRIAAAAAALIESDDSIIVASGSTVTIFAEMLKPKNRLNVVCTAVNISSHLGDILRSRRPRSRLRYHLRDQRGGEPDAADHAFLQEKHCPDGFQQIHETRACPHLSASGCGHPHHRRRSSIGSETPYRGNGRQAHNSLSDGNGIRQYNPYIVPATQNRVRNIIIYWD